MNSKKLLCVGGCFLAGFNLWPDGLSPATFVMSTTPAVHGAVGSLAAWVAGLCVLVPWAYPLSLLRSLLRKLTPLFTPAVVCVAAIDMFLIAWLLWPAGVNLRAYGFSSSGSLLRMALAIWLGVFATLVGMAAVLRWFASAKPEQRSADVEVTGSERRRQERRVDDRRKTDVPLSPGIEDRRRLDRRSVVRRHGELNPGDL